MKLVSFNDCRIGVIDETHLYDMTESLPVFLDRMPRQRMNYVVSNWGDLKDVFNGYLIVGTKLEINAVKFLTPNPAPQHVFAAPANYKKHIGELGSQAVTKKGRSAREQGFFLKAPGSLSGPSDAITLPKGSTRRFDHESELAVVISKTARNVKREDAMNYVFGYSCLIDATMRIEKDEFEEERSMRKSFETFTPTGPWIITADEILDPSKLSNRLWVNGELRQESNTKEMIVGIAELIELISSVVQLEAGDIIATGTPEGVGQLCIGDKVKIEIENVGSMTLKVEETKSRSPRPY
jgi:2-keto-4-pentenoate hydratase/2-oxohepta-3-ene-1,7-dioic acid hydratase in catechol pathway